MAAEDTLPFEERLTERLDERPNEVVKDFANQVVRRFFRTCWHAATRPRQFLRSWDGQRGQYLSAARLLTISAFVIGASYYLGKIVTPEYEQIFGTSRLGKLLEDATSGLIPFLAVLMYLVGTRMACALFGVKTRPWNLAVRLAAYITGYSVLLTPLTLAMTLAMSPGWAFTASLALSTVTVVYLVAGFEELAAMGRGRAIAASVTAIVLQYALVMASASALIYAAGWLAFRFG